MVQAERNVKGRIAPPRAFGVEQDRTLGPIRMFFGLTSPCTRASDGAGRPDEIFERRRDVRVPPRGCHQVRLEADVEEDRVGRERGGQFRPRGGMRVDPSQHGTDRTRDLRIGPALAQQLLPQRVDGRADNSSREHRGADAGPARWARSPAPSRWRPASSALHSDCVRSALASRQRRSASPKRASRRVARRPRRCTRCPTTRRPSAGGRSATARRRGRAPSGLVRTRSAPVRAPGRSTTFEDPCSWRDQRRVMSGLDQLDQRVERQVGRRGTPTSRPRRTTKPFR